MNKYTEGLEKVGNLYRLKEKVIATKKDLVETPDSIKESLKESLKEQVSEGLPIYSTYLIKLWAKKSFNKNGRNYSKVFSKVLNESKVTIGFVDHPEDGEESYKNVVLVGKNPCIIYDEETGEEWLAVYVTLVGRPHGENCEAVLEAGGFIEFSSSALGDVDTEGYVLEDGFFLERYSDIVVNSSNAQLFFKNKEEPRDTSPKADTTLYDYREEDNKVKKENLTILDKDKPNLKENVMPDNRLSEKSLELNIKSLIRDAEAKESLVERKEILESALSYAKDLTESTLANEITTKISDTEKAIHDLAEKGKSVDSLNESVSSLKEAKETLEAEIKTLKEEKVTLEENYNNLVTMYESKQFSASQKELLSNKKMKAVITSLKERATLKEKEMAKLEEKVKYLEALANTKVEADKVVALNEEVKRLMLENEELNTKVASLNESLRKTRRLVVAGRGSLAPKKEESVKEDKKEDLVEKRKPSFFNSKEVEIYFNALLEDDDSLMRFKNKFASFNSLKEAQKFRMNMDSLHEKAEKVESKDVSIDNILASKGYI